MLGMGLRCELMGKANPTCLPAPTTCGWARTVIMWPLEGTFCRLDIRDAERAQGLQPGHTAVDSAEPGDTDGVRTKRFELVGNALPGEVHRLPVKCISCHMQKQPLRWSADIACECAGSGGAGPSMAAHARLPASAAVVRLCCALRICADRCLPLHLEHNCQQVRDVSAAWICPRGDVLPRAELHRQPRERAVQP